MIEHKNQLFIQPLMDEICVAWQEMNKKPLTHLRFQHFMTYFSTGNRLKHGEDYFARRKELLVAGLYAIEKGTPASIEKLEEVIFLILQEYTWALPAHLDENQLNSQEVIGCIDLFAAETAQALAEISYQLHDKLSPILLSFINYEIERRILKPFETKAWEWELKENNWSAVIAGCIGMVTLRMIDDVKRRTKILARLDTAFQSFLRGFGDDGACVEGVGYWIYGFGYYIYYAETLAEVTGDLTYFQLPKIKAIAEFPYYTEISANRFPPFSDYNQTSLPSGLLAIIKQRLQVLLPEVTAVSALDSDHCYRFASMIFNLKFSEPIKRQAENQTVHYFKDSQWLVVRDLKKEVFFAAHGGRNDESHNHNDLGHFVYGDFEQLALTDLGAGEYTKDYFNDDKRYQYFVNNARSHSLPIINGETQQAGAYQAEVIQFEQTASEVSLTFELKSAYPKNLELLSFQRSFSLNLSSYQLTIRDFFHFSTEENQVIENFITTQQVEIEAQKEAVFKGKKFTTRLSTPTTIEVISEDYVNHFGKNNVAYQIQNQFNIGQECELVYQIDKE
ncbi:MAG: heparinase II/III family protein [Streptococcaceae bacterium]|jgi:hypothetical protein|nr:heparinase II/III family protein [Streptococcaceae bacterium]